MRCCFLKHVQIWSRALELEKAVGVPIIVIDQTELHTQLQTLCDNAIGIKGKTYAEGQLKSYMRTPGTLIMRL